MKQDINYVIMRYNGRDAAPVKSIEDRADARAYAKRMNARITKYLYKAVPVKKA